MTDRYPAIEPYEVGRLAVSDGHEIYWETVGVAGGTPALFLHGGPGGAIDVSHRQLFDPTAYRAVLFDQRGCGRSSPQAVDAKADLSTNTTQHLIDDIEQLREHLGIDRWVVTGVSWGVTLGLVYAQQHPSRVSAMMFAAITAGTKRETDWITQDMRRVFPQEWDRFISMLPEAERGGDPAAGYARLLADPNPAVQRTAAGEWCRWEDTHMSLAPDARPWLQHEPPEYQQIFARLVTHYWSNRCFLAPDQIRNAMPRIVEIPAVLIHGRYDVSDPLDTAWDLHKAWPSSRLVVLEDAGHGGISMVSSCIDALDELRDSK